MLGAWLAVGSGINCSVKRGHILVAVLFVSLQVAGCIAKSPDAYGDQAYD